MPPRNSQPRRVTAGTIGSWLAVLMVTLAVLLVGVVGPATAVVGPATSQAQTAAPVPIDEETVLIELTAAGDARVSVITPFDLTTQAERQAFERLRANQPATSQLLATYRERMAAVADRAAERTGRPMSVRDPAIELTVTEDGSRGFVRLTVTWTELAAVDGDRLTVGAPFDDGFTSNAQVVVVGPEGAKLDQARPSPTTRQGVTVGWAGGSDLSGFALTYALGAGSPDAAPSSGAESLSPGGQPGFGPVVVIMALVALITHVLVVRRYRH